MAYVSANQVKSNRVHQKHYVTYCTVTRHREHLSINTYLLSKLQCQKKKTGITESASGAAILEQFLGGFAKLALLSYIIVA